MPHTKPDPTDETRTLIIHDGQRVGTVEPSFDRWTIYGAVNGDIGLGDEPTFDTREEAKEAALLMAERVFGAEQREAA